MQNIMSTAASGNRIHILFAGRMNAGKSSLINAFTGQHVSIVSKTAGTTTDVVRKPMEIHGVGPCVLMDTAGFDDTGDLGSLRSSASRKAMDAADILILLFSYNAPDIEMEKAWAEEALKTGAPVIGVAAKCDLLSPEEKQALLDRIGKLNIPAVAVSAATGEGIDELKKCIVTEMIPYHQTRTITSGLVKEGDSVILVMPQDPQAPEGRLILPEVQTLRDLLDRECIATCVSVKGLPRALGRMKTAPDLIITDSQAFAEVSRMKPEGTRLTSFSVLFAALKGDINYYVDSVSAIDRLTDHSRVLIAEICSHAPMQEDIGRIKIPRLLRKRAGEGLQVDVCAGADFPEDLKGYDLIIQCGGCMFNRHHVLSRIERAKRAGVPMSNYGIVLAYMNGILKGLEIPGRQTAEN